ARNEQGRDLEPDLRLVLEILQCLQHRTELARTQRLVEAVGETLQVDVGGVHVPEEFDARLRCNVAGAHRYGLDTARATSLCHIDRVFEEYHGIIVGEGDRAAAAAHRRFGDRLG